MAPDRPPTDRMLPLVSAPDARTRINS